MMMLRNYALICAIAFFGSAYASQLERFGKMFGGSKPRLAGQQGRHLHWGNPKCDHYVSMATEDIHTKILGIREKLLKECTKISAFSEHPAGAKWLKCISGIKYTTMEQSKMNGKIRHKLPYTRGSPQDLCEIIKGLTIKVWTKEIGDPWTATQFTMLRSNCVLWDAPDKSHTYDRYRLTPTFRVHENCEAMDYMYITWMQAYIIVLYQTHSEDERKQLLRDADYPYVRSLYPTISTMKKCGSLSISDVRKEMIKNATHDLKKNCFYPNVEALESIIARRSTPDGNTKW
jgi:hypothetical protein